MFESAEVGHKIEKERYKSEAPKLRAALLAAQYDLKANGKFPVIILINGIHSAGKAETVNLLSEWMDPRLIKTRAFGDLTAEEKERPRMWRYWQALPPKGRIGVLFANWYTMPIVNRVHGRLKTAELQAEIERIVRFETMLVQEGALLLKFWFHLSQEQQRKRLRSLARDPNTSWRVSDRDRHNLKRYDAYVEVSEHALRETSTGDAPWTVVEGVDERYRNLTVAQTIFSALRSRLDRPAASPLASRSAPLIAPIDGLQILDRLNLRQKLTKPQYEKELEKWQGRLNTITRKPKFAQHSVVAVFEGNDAAGKGGAIRRVTSALDARSYDIVQIAAPTEEERAQPYLWRFWRHVPRHGRITIFDRSWYGRVLVERVEGFCSEYDWMRAYSEINDFEEQLVESGVIVVKFWLAISKAEQLRRFKERENVAFKKFKITEEDWRNRKKWDAYVHAVNDMVERTSTRLAPWTLVEANDKNHARVKVLRTLTKAIEDGV